jgi:hypothetical protein
MNQVVYAFVRFQPPTLGHQQLIETVKRIAQERGCDYAIYVSKTQDSKKNPLTIEQKMWYLQKFFPDTDFTAANDLARTPIEAVKELNKRYQNLIVVAGEDRMNLHELLRKYNHAEYEFDTIDFVSSGDRDTDSPEIAGISGTVVREHAKTGDLKSFKSKLPSTATDEIAQKLMADVQEGLKSKGKKIKTTPKENADQGGSYATNKPGFPGQGRYTDAVRSDTGFNIG